MIRTEGHATESASGLHRLVHGEKVVAAGEHGVVVSGRVGGEKERDVFCLAG